LPICLIGSAVTYFPQSLVQDVWQLLVLRLLLGLFIGGLMPSAFALVTKVVPQNRRGSAFGFIGTATSLANFMGPMSAAGLVAFWSLRQVFFVTAVLYFLAFLWVLVGFRRYHSELMGDAKVSST
jgi:DHA1 family multidrug resistance protein-like MFS transporter